MKYRAEIDGLRALAVIPVVLFHAGFEHFSGGYVGVDVFFVISGYLITSIILKDIEQDRFSIVFFYERRARRILPALIGMIAVCIPFAWAWLPPKEMVDFGQSLLAVAFFSSNILFWQESGYFNTTAELKPLLHTWSLSVEEQYYVLFPALLILMWKFSRNRTFSVLIVLFIASFGLGFWGAKNAPAAAFYLLPTRGWEILLGALCAFSADRFKTPNRVVAETLCITGLGLIVWAVINFDAATPIPGFLVLIPCGGAALLILFAKDGTLSQGILKQRPLVFVGLVSYSFYLWHYPFLAFARQFRDIDALPFLAIVLVLLSFFVAVASWRFVEKPFRSGAIFGRRTIFRLSGIGLVCMAALGGTIVADGGNVGRFSNEAIAAYQKAITDENPLRDLCRGETGQEIRVPRDECWYGDGERKILMWGDSHVDTAPLVLSEIMPNASVYHAGFASCPPVFGVWRVDKRSDCEAFNEAVWEFLQTQSFDAVILNARWRVYAEGTKFDNGEGGVEHFRPTFSGIENVSDDKSRVKSVLQAYRESIAAIAQEIYPKPLILIYQIPEVGFNVPDAQFDLPLRLDAKQQDSTRAKAYELANGRVAGSLDGIDGGNIVRVYPADVFCDNTVPNRCIVSADNVLYYVDDNHLSFEGARLLMSEAAETIELTILPN